MSTLWRYRTGAAFGMLVCAATAIWIAVVAEERAGVLTVAIMDVGQGDAIFLQSPTGVEVLVDGGPDSSVLRELPRLMRPFDRSLDAVIETHPDADHSAGLVDVLDRYEVGVFIEPGVPKETATFAALRREVTESGMPHLVARRGMRLDLGGGVLLDVLYPSKDVSTLPPSRANDGGIVMKLAHGEASMLLMADVTSSVEAELVGLDGAKLDIDVLKVGHHGSRTSTSDAFVRAATPAAAVVSVGERNRYGHPTQDVLSTLERNNVQTFRTDEDGTVVFISDGGEFIRVR